MPVKPDPANPDPANPPPFDLAAFEAKFSKMINDTVNGAVKNLTNEFGKKFAPLKADPDPANPDPANPNPPAPPDPKKTMDVPELNALVIKLQGQLTNLQKESTQNKELAEKEAAARIENERLGEIRSILNDISFKDQNTRELFFKATKDDVKRVDDGELIAETPTGLLPAKDYFSNLAEQQYPHLLSPTGKSGAGASPSKTGSGRRMVSMSDITPEKIAAMKPEEHREMLDKILAGQISA